MGGRLLSFGWVYKRGRRYGAIGEHAFFLEQGL
jgi:hypothetical protein